MKALKKFISENKREAILISAIFLVALGIRLFKIDQYLTFLGDEGRDVRVVRDLITKADLIFIGPQTSIGNMYLGPWYYYMMAPFLFLTNLNPVGPAIMVALLSSLTIVFTWWVGRTWFSKKAGIIAALLFALSPVSIIYSRSSWNPNPMPFFALLAVWSVWHIWHHRQYKWIPVLAFSIGMALNMHYLGLLLLPALGIFWLISLKDSLKNDKTKQQFIKQSIVAIITFAFLMSPLLLFDLKHNGQNTNAFKAFFTDRQTTVNFNPLNSDRWGLIAEKMVSDLVLGTSTETVLVTTATITLLVIFFFIRTSKDKKAYTLLLTWILVGYLGLVIYKQHVYAHYFGFLYPAIYLLLGYLSSRLLNKGLPAKLAAILALSFLIYTNLQNSPLKYQPNQQLKRTKTVVNLIIEQSNNEEFNFALIAKQNYDESYRYFLENKQAKMIRGEDHLTDQLFVVCEDGDKCQPEGNPQYQVAIFGPSHVVQEWQVDHIRIFKLLHTE